MHYACNVPTTFGIANNHSGNQTKKDQCKDISYKFSGFEIGLGMIFADSLPYVVAAGRNESEENCEYAT